MNNNELQVFCYNLSQFILIVKHNNKKNNSNDVNNHSVELDSAHASNPINLGM